MSGFYLLALIAIWLFVGWIVSRLWKRWKPTDLRWKTIHFVAGILLFSVWFGGAFWEAAGKKMYWDAKVRKLCAIDGGVKVYETVELPTEMFDKWGMVKFYQPVQKENALGSDYVLKRKVTFFREKKPTIERIHYLILRRSGGKALGETVLYTRGGGDLPGLWEGSSYACPAYKDAGINQLIKSVFHKTKGVYQ